MGNGLTKEQASLTFAYARRASTGNEVEEAPTRSLASPRYGTVVPLGRALANRAHSPSTASLSLAQMLAQDELPSNPADFANSKKYKPVILAQLFPVSYIGLCSQRLVHITANIGLLSTTTTLQLCCNDLTAIPPEIGYMKSLMSLSISKNRITELPDTIGCLENLVELKAAENLLTSLPASIGRLTKLNTLHLEKNQLRRLPVQLGDLQNLISLDISDNPINILPAEMGRLKHLRRLRTENCPLLTELPADGGNAIPSLRELAARVIVRLQLPILRITQEDVKDYLTSAHQCSFCGGPFFETFVTRGKFVEKNDIQIPLEYRLCSAHWNSEQERIASLFCPPPSTAPPVEPVLSMDAIQEPSHHLLSPTPSESSDGDGSIHTVKHMAHATVPLASLQKAPSLPALPFASRKTKSRLRMSVTRSLSSLLNRNS